MHEMEQKRTHHGNVHIVVFTETVGWLRDIVVEKRRKGLEIWTVIKISWIF